MKQILFLFAILVAAFASAQTKSKTFGTSVVKGTHTMTVLVKTSQAINNSSGGNGITQPVPVQTAKWLTIKSSI